MKHLLLAGLMAISMNALAGDKGNGGIVIKCGERIRLADFYEVEVLPGLSSLKIKSSTEDVDAQVSTAFEKLARVSDDESLYTELMVKYERLKSNISWLNGTFSWGNTEDLGRFPLVEGCKPINVINYFDEDFADAQLPLFESLTNTEKAGLFVHEIIYKMTRDISNQRTSLPARRMTALLFSNNKDLELLKGMFLSYLNSRKDVLVFHQDAAKPASVMDLSGTTVKGAAWVYFNNVQQNGKPLETSKNNVRYDIKALNPKKVEKISFNILLKGTNGSFSVSMNPKFLNGTESSYSSQIEFKGEVRNGHAFVTGQIVFVPESVKKFIFGRM